MDAVTKANLNQFVMAQELTQTDVEKQFEYLFRNNLLSANYKALRYHILMTMRAMIYKSLSSPDMNSRAMTKLCAEIDRRMWDPDQALVDLTEAALLVVESFNEAGKAIDRDEARSQESTDLVIDKLRKKLHPAVP